MTSHHDFLIRGNDYLAKSPDFKLVGRDEELSRLSGILMRKNANSVLLVGPGGAGCSALAKGLQASKKNPDAPFDIVSKRFFWLDTDGLFSSGDSKIINENFEKIVGTLSRMPETVLIIDDAKDFIEGTRNSGCSNIINSLMREVKNKKFQLVLESRDDDLETVLKCHSDMREFYTMFEVNEPSEPAQHIILANTAASLEKHHGIKISQEAIDAAIEITNKYRAKDLGLSRAQPERSHTLLDRALSAYRLSAHARAPQLDELEARLKAVKGVLEGGDATGDLAGRGRDELDGLQASLQSDIQDVEKQWAQQRETLRKLYHEQSVGEEKIRELEAQIEEQRLKEKEARKSKSPVADSDEERAEAESNFNSFLQKTSDAGFESDAIQGLQARMATYQEKVAQNKEKYDELMQKVNSSLLLTKDHVLAEFSRLSGIPVNRLGQDERAKLLNLQKNLSSRVFGQDQAIVALTDAVQTARVGLKEPNKPQASFMFLGPSGVGKTELAKVLTGIMYDDERALLRFDMSEYMEKHAVAKLIGAPPGYEGYEAGGILTNSVRRNPRCVLLFDEIEKADKSVFDLFLQILDDARLTDNRGLTASFEEAIIIMTTNVGTRFFLDRNLGYEESRALAMEELESQYRGEFLNRYNGRQNIICFNRLELPDIERIAARNLRKLNEKIVRQGLEVTMTQEDLSAMCRDHYQPVHGARGIAGYVDTKIKPAVAKTILQTPDAKGLMTVTYQGGNLVIGQPVPVTANDSDKKLPISTVFQKAAP